MTAEVSRKGMSLDVYALSQALGVGLVADTFTIRVADPTSAVTKAQLQAALATYLSAQRPATPAPVFDPTRLAAVDTSVITDPAVRSVFDAFKAALQPQGA